MSTWSSLVTSLRGSMSSIEARIGGRMLEPSRKDRVVNETPREKDKDLHPQMARTGT